MADDWETAAIVLEAVTAVEARARVKEIPAPVEDGTAERRSAATVLVDLALDMFDLGISEDGEPFATPRSGAAHVARRLRGGKRSLRAELANLYRKTQGKVPPQQALADALLVLEGIAQECDPAPLHLRVAEAAGATWVDIGDTTGRVIRIAPDGWSIEDAAPVIFQRTELTSALPDPIPGGSIADLWQFLNVKEADRPLLLAAAVAAYIPDIPHPIPAFTGEQGTAKSTTARMLVDLLDPSPVPLRKPPRDAETWVTAASGSWVVSIDNVSSIPDWLSESLCRAVTGDGDVRRALYTDGGLAVFAFRRCVVLTGIDLGGLRGDLADRLLMIQLNRIPDENRLEERDLMRRWAEARPRILGALLTLVSNVTSYASYASNEYGQSQDDETSYASQKSPNWSLRLGSKPRMADFARVIVGVDQVLGTEGMKRYFEQGKDLAADTLTASPFTSLMLTTVTEFEGTAADLLEEVTPEVQGWRVPRGWPRNARAVTTLLRRDAPALRKNGWTVDDLGANRDHATIWRVTHPEIARISTSPTSHTSQVATYASDESNEYGPSKDDGAPAKPTGAKGQKQPGATCPKHGTPTHQGMCGRCAAEGVSA